MMFVVLAVYLATMRRLRIIPGAAAAVPTVLAPLLFVGCGRAGNAGLQQALRDRIDASGAEVVGVYFRDLDRGDSVTIAADARMHAASMMKVPVLIQLYRDRDAGRLSLDDSVTITRTFRSIVDDSPYELNEEDDSDSTLYRRIGEREAIRPLAERMITWSSNLATNMIVGLVGADRVQATMRELGADSIVVLRGVEDIKAYRAGLNNTTTARDLGILLSAIALGTAASDSSCREMTDILARQEFNEGIPAGLPPGTRVAHKTGWITGIRHDGGIVYAPGGHRYVLVVLTKGIENPTAADSLITAISAAVYTHVSGS